MIDYNLDGKEKNGKCTAIIVASGKSRRMGLAINKLYLDINGQQVLARTLIAFQASKFVDEIILVVNPEDIAYCALEFVKAYEITKVKRIVEGGNTRQESVYNGLLELEQDTETVLVHDGARPLVSQNIIFNVITECYKNGAVIPAIKQKNTIKQVDNNQFIVKTLERDNLWDAQTPQAFKKDIIISAYENAIRNGIQATDDSSLVELLGYNIKIIEGSYENIKITTPIDVKLATLILKENEQDY